MRIKYPIILLLITYLTSSQQAFTQSDINTELGLQYIDHASGNILNYRIPNINSDFGSRICPGCSKWHKGIDLNRSDEIDYGDAIISPVTGTIIKIKRTNNNYIYMVVGNSGDIDYGYGHIFTNNYTNAIDKYFKVGNFVLKKMESPNNSHWAIIDLINSRALSEVPGAIVKYGEQPFTTVNVVQAGWPIAPVGNSAATNGTHLHLYLFKDPGLANPITLNNCKNPLLTLSHQENTRFDITIEELTNLTEYGLTNFYEGYKQASVKVKIRMVGAGDDPTYTEQIMLIDSAMLQIKKFGEQDSKYTTILGENHESEIILGGRNDHKRKPSAGYPLTNASFDIAGQYGDATNVGVDPHAYDDSNPHPWDYWLFSDIYTRIKNTDDLGGVLELANSNAEARYSDGVYLIRPKAYRVDNSEAVNPNNPVNNAPRQIIIDNFHPFVSDVRVKEAGGAFYKYERGWHWVGNHYLLTPLPESEILSQDYDVAVEITTSEPMKKVVLNTGNHPELVQYCGEDLNKTQWNFTLSRFFLNAGMQQLSISGEDLAGNRVLANPSIVHIRQSNTEWQPPLPAIVGPDIWHSFMFGNTDVDFDAQQTGMAFNHIEFTDKSKITGSYYWEFGDLNNSVANTKDAAYTYGNLGTYMVTHTVNQSSITKPVSVNQITIPESQFVYSPCFFNLKSSLSNVDVDFFSTSNGLISSYLWSFGDGVTSTEPNPKGILLSLHEWHTVSLTVTNIAGSDTYVQDIYLDPDAFPFISIFDWQLDYFLYDFEIFASNFKPDKPVAYTIDFGDGTSEQTGELLEPSHVFHHQYFSMGKFLVVAAAKGTDQNGNEKTVSSAKMVSVSPMELNVEIVYFAPNNPPYPMQTVTLNVTVNPSCDFDGNMAIYKIGDPTFFQTWNFSSSNSQREYQFPQAGNYRVVADVCNAQMGVTGYDEKEIIIENAPDYIDAYLFGPSVLSLNTDYSYEARLSAIGNPGVPNSKWFATNLKWTLIKPDNQEVVISESFDYWDAPYIKYKTFQFDMEGQYKLRVEAWNNQHGYDNNNLIGPQYANMISFYDYDELTISVSASIPALKILSATFPDPVSASGNEDIVLTFTNPSTTPIRWEVDQGTGIPCNNCITIPSPSTGQNLANSYEISMTIDVRLNLEDNRRFTQVRISGYDANNNHVQGSPAYLHIDQYGISGPSGFILKGENLNQNFGNSVSIDESTVLVGAPSVITGLSGSAFIYEKNVFGDWVKKATLMPNGTDESFGATIDISGDNIVVTGSNSEYGYFFRKPVAGWNGNMLPDKRLAHGFSNNQHIRAALWGDYAVISSAFQDNNSGVVKLFYRNQGGVDNWGLIKTIQDCSMNDYFGYSVDLYNDRLVVGAPQKGSYRGFIMVYERNYNGADSWALVQRINPSVTSEKPDMRFGQSVAVFQDAITTSYYYSYNNQIDVGNLYFPVYTCSDGLQFELTGEGGWTIHFAVESQSNYIYSSSMYKNLFNESVNCPSHYDYLSLFGGPFYYDNRGVIGECSSEYDSYCDEWFYTYSYPPDYFFPDHYSDEYYGLSVAQSYSYRVTGIPGYVRTQGSRGAVYVSNNSPNKIKSNFEAEVDFEFTNFDKPVGHYSTFNGRNISLGGNGLPATVSSGAHIQYEAGEIQMKNGFLADLGTEFIAKSLEENNGLLKKAKGKNEPDEYHDIDVISRFRVLCPDFPWHRFDFFNDVRVVEDKEGLLHQNQSSGGSSTGINQEPGSENSDKPVNCLQLNGFDRLFLFPQKKLQ